MKQKIVVRAIALALAFPAGLAYAQLPVMAKPDSLLSIDQNRPAVIEGIVGTWGSEIAKLGVPGSELRKALEGIRADQLLAARGALRERPARRPRERAAPGDAERRPQR